MKNYIFPLCILLITIQSFAQRTKQYVYEMNYAALSLKVNPIALIEADQAIGVAIEYRLSQRIGIQLQGDYIVNSIAFSSKRIVSNVIGYRLIPECRIYNKIANKRNLQRYTSFQISYKTMQKDISSWEQRNNFEELKEITFRKNAYAAAIAFGVQKNPKRIGFDFNLGIGIKCKILHDIPKTSVTDWNNDQYQPIFGELQTGIYPHVVANFKFCYKLKAGFSPEKEIDLK